MRYVSVVVQGRVQGVGYRQATADRARELRVQGFVRNRDDGTVEVEAAGADTQVAELLDWLERGPPTARVERIDCQELDEGPWQDFTVR